MGIFAAECLGCSDMIHSGNREERGSCWPPNTSVGDS